MTRNDAGIRRFELRKGDAGMAPESAKPGQLRPPRFAAGAICDMDGRFFGVNSMYGVPTFALGESAACYRDGAGFRSRRRRDLT